MDRTSPKDQLRTHPLLDTAVFIVLLIVLYFTTLRSYLLFHSLAELASIIVAVALFTIAWNSRQFIKNPYLMFIGIAYFFIGLVDLMHTLSYSGMQIFGDYDFATQLWIGGRYMESVSLLLAFVFVGKTRKVRPFAVLLAYTVITALLLISVFHWKNFPECFVAGEGLTPFKKVSEYIISAILAAAIVLLVWNRRRFEPGIMRLLLFSLIATILSELAFTFYVSAYGLSNLVGHYFKLVSFFLIYRAVIMHGIRTPYQLIFRDLDAANTELRDALAKVKTLSGLLPICASCKRIRDDKGYWEQIETFIGEHSDADFSHGICPDCLKKLYPEEHERMTRRDSGAPS